MFNNIYLFSCIHMLIIGCICCLIIIHHCSEIKEILKERSRVTEEEKKKVSPEGTSVSPHEATILMPEGTRTASPEETTVTPAPVGTLLELGEDTFELCGGISKLTTHK